MTLGGVIAIFAVALCVVLGALSSLHAQAYPEKPIKVVVPAAPGGPSDVPARLASQILQSKLGQPIVIEHRPGAAGAIGMREVAKASPDGYTLLSGGSGMLAVVPALSLSAGYDPTKDFVGVAKFYEGFQILVVHPSSPWRTVQEIIEHAKANPGAINYAHTGAASIPHLAGELFASSTGAQLVAVPYRSGGEAITAVLSRAVDLAFENVTLLLPLIAERKLRALAVTSRTRSPHAPDVPTMIEAGVSDFEVLTFFGIVAPAGTPVPVVNLLNATLNAAISTPDLQEAVRKLGAMSRPQTSVEFDAFIAAQMRQWAAIGKAANIRID
jgi:tripartite-type tricarboxylate transporter receptor subunit TctC